MSFSKTIPQMRDRSKTVTRRLFPSAWAKLHRGDRVWAVEKGQGLRKGEKVKHIHGILIENVRVEPLDNITDEEVVKEGFPNLNRKQFIEMFCKMNKCTPTALVVRIEFLHGIYPPGVMPE